MSKGEIFIQPRENDLSFHIDTEKLVGVDEALGPHGIGSFVLREVLDESQLSLVREEIFESGTIRWHDNHDRWVNARGMEIIENHTAFALKLHRGDPAPVAALPRMRALAENIQELVRGLSFRFPALHDWTADEMSLHRYDDPEIGLSFHKDNLRFIGIIAVLTVEGESDVEIMDGSGEVHTLPVGPGDVNLTRGSKLYPKWDEAGRPVNLCPDHQVSNLRTPFRTSFIVRANERPGDLVPGFEYFNWHGDDQS